MDSDLISHLTGWESRSVADGHAALREVADREFSGALTDGTAWLLALNGRIVGAFDGGIEAFDADAGGTAYVAPDPALPLLFAMLERGDDAETRGRYYTKDVPLERVDQTLSTGEFTGYVELSENVLSGEYYVVYYRGRRMPVAFVGSGPTLLTGEEAFERAADEVGVYEVRAVDVDVTDPVAVNGDSAAAETETETATPASPDTDGRVGVGVADSDDADDRDREVDRTSGAPADASDGGDPRSIPGLDPHDAGGGNAIAGTGAEAEVADADVGADAGRETDGETQKAAALRRRLRAAEADRDRHRAAAEHLAAARRSAAAVAEREEMEPDAALADANLFVRYASRSRPTLADAIAGEADRDAVEANLRVEHHTEFEEASVAVDGREFAAFLEDTAEYAFVDWFLREFPYEVRATGNQTALADLYEAVAAVDRIELRGELTLREATDQREAATRSFDVIFRSRTGDPLVVADVSESRAPVARDAATDLVESVRDSAGTFDSIVGAFLVTASYFEPGAFEAVSDAVGGGFFDRGNRESYVKLSRKSGYHLCLVEARDRDFHVTVPEL